MTSAGTIYVIIPVYNAEKYVTQAIESVLSQPYARMEIVCVDDGSRDNSLHVLQQYAATYSNIHIIHQQNAGVSAARNTGIESVLARCADNDYLIFLDADDLWARNVVTEQAVLEWNGADCVGYTSVRCTNDLAMVARIPKLEPRLLPGGQKGLWCHTGQHMGAMFYSCKIIQKYPIRFVDGLKYGEDGLFKLVCLFFADNIRLVDQVLYLYRMNPVSAIHSRKYGIEHIAPIVRAYLKTGILLKPYESDTRGTARFCDTLAGVYAIEMITEHHQQLRSNRSLQAFLSKNPNIAEAIARLNPNDLADNNKKTYHLYTRCPVRFRLINYLTGIKNYFLRILTSSKYLLHTVQKRKYSIPNPYL